MIRLPKLTKDNEYEIERVLLYENDKKGYSDLIITITLNDSIQNYDRIMFICGNYYSMGDCIVDVYQRWFDVKDIVIATSDPNINNSDPDYADICVYTNMFYLENTDPSDPDQPTIDLVCNKYYQIDVRFTSYFGLVADTINKTSSIRKIFGYRLKKKNIKLITQFLSNLNKKLVVLC